MIHTDLLRRGAIQALALLLSAAVQAADIEVNHAADVVADDGRCSLREALYAAYSDSASGASEGECRAGERGRDVVVLPRDTHFDIGDPLLVVTELEVRGNGSTIDASGRAPSVFATLLDPIHRHDVGTLVLRDLVITGASAATEIGALADLGFGIRVHRCHVVDNEGLGAWGRVSFFESTLSNNRLGHLSVRGETAEIVNSTLSGTRGVSVRAEAGAEVRLTHATVVDHGLGFEVEDGVIRVENSLVSAGRGVNCRGATPVFAGRNVVDDESCGGSVASRRVDARLELAALASREGEPPTHALGAGSSGIDRGDSAICERAGGTDQRGLARSRGGACDLGAYERMAPARTAGGYGAAIALAPSLAFCIVAFAIRSRVRRR